MTMNDYAALAVGGIVGLAIGAFLLFLLGFVLRYLWNTTLPEVLGVKPITTWQAIKILFIASILFGGHRVVSAPPDPTPAPAKSALVSPEPLPWRALPG